MTRPSPFSSLLVAVFAFGCAVARNPDLGNSTNSGVDSGSGGMQAVGGPCASDSNCMWIPGGAHCLTQAQAGDFGEGAPGGYCTSNSCTVSAPTMSCGAGTTCGSLMQAGSATTFCEAACANQSECRAGFDCVAGGCIPGAPIPDGGFPDSGTMMNPDGGTITNPDGGTTGNGDGGTNTHDAGVTCSTPTTISGTVHAPTVPATGITPDPIFGAIVYVPTTTVEPFTPGVACEPCGAVLSGSPLVQTTTAVDGTYSLKVSPGTNVPVVVQIGRWRRQLKVATVTACQNNAVPDDDDRLPRTHAEGDIPLIAMVTGSADVIECELLQFGIDQSEFVNPGGASGGRVEMYVNNGAGLDAGTPDAGTPAMSVLTGNPATLAKYDMVLMSCPGAQINQTSTDQTNVVNYANAGGRFFANHFNFVWFDDPGITPAGSVQPWASTATWLGAGGTMANSVAETVDQSTATGVAFAQWLENVGASTTLGTLTVSPVKFDFTAVTAPGQRWFYDTAMNNYPMAYSFTTPVGAASGAQCGAAMFADYHTGLTATVTTGSTFPGECGTLTALTAQEKALEFMLFSLGSCVGP